jgi:hypothetical protein
MIQVGDSMPCPTVRGWYASSCAHVTSRRRVARSLVSETACRPHLVWMTPARYLL